MLFASNRGNEDIYDYDLYFVNIQVDFDSQEIRVLNQPEKLANKDFEGINTSSKEFFPFIPKPYSGSESEPNYLYFSSDRFKKDYKETEKTSVKNVGGFDIYKFPIYLKCQPPKVTYIVHLVDSLNPRRALKGPFKVELLDENNRVVSSNSNNPSVFNLQYDKNYRSRGTSLYDGIECTGADSTISSYRFIHRRKIDTIVEYVVKVDYDSIVGGRTVTYFDTTQVKEVIPVNELSKVTSSSDRIIKELTMQGDMVHITYFDIKKRTEIEQGRIIKKQRNEIHKKREERIVESVHSAKDILGLSVKSRIGTIPNTIYNSDVTIHDTIYVVPEFFKFPPCKWEYITIQDDYRRNVPYFQTGFWEVNTSRNIERHVSELRSRQYNGASFIELQPENMYFGYRRGDLSDEQVEARTRRWENRVATYRKYARQVDRNLKDMVYEVADVVLPKFHRLDSILPQLNSRLIIQLEAYSDYRDIIGGKYLTNEQVKYFGVDYDEKSTAFRNFSLVEINTGDQLDEKNEILSRLRAYFGYKELMNLLEKNPLFKQYLDKGLVVMPTNVKSEKEFNDAIAKAKIVITTVGKRIDEKAVSRIPSYKGEEGDYYMLDSVRRINVVVHRVQYGNGRVIKTDCCTETPIHPLGASGKSSKKEDEIKHLSVESQSKELKNQKDNLGSISASSARFYQVSCGSFQNIQNASELLDVLIKDKRTDYAIETVDLNGATFYRVRSKMYKDLDECQVEYEAVNKILKAKSIKTDVMILPIE